MVFTFYKFLEDSSIPHNRKSNAMLGPGCKSPSSCRHKGELGQQGAWWKHVGGRETGQGSSLDKGTGPRLHATQELSPCLILY